MTWLWSSLVLLAAIVLLGAFYTIWTNRFPWERK